MSILDKKKVSRKGKVEGDFLVLDDPFGEQYPGVFEMLARVKHQGKDRLAGRLIFYAEMNRATLVLVDAESKEVTFYSAETFAEALEGLEKALQAGTCDWRVDKKSYLKK